MDIRSGGVTLFLAMAVISAAEPTTAPTAPVAGSTAAGSKVAFLALPGLGTNDKLMSGLYLNNLVLGQNSLLIIDTNVQVYFINSNNWGLANIRLLNNQSPNFAGDAHSYNNAINGLHQLMVVPEPNILLLLYVGAITALGVRRRLAAAARSKGIRTAR